VVENLADPSRALTSNTADSPSSGMLHEFTSSSLISAGERVQATHKLVPVDGNGTPGVSKERQEVNQW
jgi:hypothetical protein